MNQPTTSVAVVAHPKPAQKVGDLDLVTHDDGFRIAREPQPWSICLRNGALIGVGLGVMTGLFTGKDHGLVWGLVGFFIMLWAGLLGAVLVMRRRLLVEVKGTVLLWQDTARFFGRNLHSIALDEIEAVDVNQAWTRIELLERSGRRTILLPGLKQPGLDIVAHLIAQQLKGRG